MLAALAPAWPRGLTELLDAVRIAVRSNGWQLGGLAVREAPEAPAVPGALETYSQTAPLAIRRVLREAPSFAWRRNTLWIESKPFITFDGLPAKRFG